MFEKQYQIKDLTEFKNKIKEAMPDEYDVSIIDAKIDITNKRAKSVFKGEIASAPDGCVIKGEFSIDKLISIAAWVLVAVYIAFLLFTYVMGALFYDYQIFIMIAAAGSIIIMNRISDKKTAPVKEALDKLK